MEGENLFMNLGNTMPYGMTRQNEQHGTSEQLQNCSLNPNWDNSVEKNDPFQTAFSSMVSFPATANPAAATTGAAGENFVLRELIGRLGSICNSGEVSPHLNSPPNLNLSMVDYQITANLPFQGNHYPFASNASGELNGQLGLNNSGFLNGFVSKLESSCKISRVSSNQSLKVSEAQQNTDFRDSGENSSVSEQIPDGNSKKRKSISKGKGKDIPLSTSGEDADAAAAEDDEVNGKRSKSDEDDADEKAAKSKAEQSGNKKGNKYDKKAAEPPKDYIHVRARRGQATDAHSLAERVRREKISQRMRFLQDLVPGCNKVTGKAVMLDEIINYVQSLQRQVEFLSMKLATVNPSVDVNLEELVSKEVFQSCGSLPQGNYAPENAASALPFPYQLQQAANLQHFSPNGPKSSLPMDHHVASAFGPNSSIHPEAAPLGSTFWEDDLQDVVCRQNQTQDFHGHVPTAQMKVEL